MKSHKPDFLKGYQRLFLNAGVPANFLDLAYRTFSTRGVSETGLVI
jgi:hypothetical protein